ncbi:MAG: choice-of-anchor Q domain-containing protein, partial [Acidiferrobacter sp.]
LYYDPAGVTFEWDDKNIYNMPFNTWQQTTGLELNTIVANPLYTNITPVGAIMPSVTGNTLLSLSANSPAINAGIVLPSVTHDINGIARPISGSYDLGAYQSAP